LETRKHSRYQDGIKSLCRAIVTLAGLAFAAVGCTGCEEGSPGEWTIDALSVFASVAAVSLAFVSPAHAQDKLASVDEPSAVPTFESIGVVVPFSGDDDRDATARIEFRKRGV